MKYLSVNIIRLRYNNRFFVGCLVVIIVLIHNYTLLAQAEKADLRKIGEYINKASSYSADLEYVYYSTYEDQTFDEKILGKYARTNTSTYLKFGQIESVTTDHYYFSIDHEEKMIDISERLKKGDMSKPVGIVNFDTLINFKNDIKYFPKNSTTNVCEIVSDFIEYEKVQIFYNKNTFEIQKMVLFFPIQIEEDYLEHAEGFEVIEKEGTAPRIEILYKNVKRNEELQADLFSYDKFIINRGTNNYSCKPEYKNYIIN
jgi:hypothetical protein